jgi:hypothetical protein
MRCFGSGSVAFGRCVEWGWSEALWSVIFCRKRRGLSADEQSAAFRQRDHADGTGSKMQTVVHSGGPRALPTMPILS